MAIVSGQAYREILEQIQSEKKVPIQEESEALENTEMMGEFSGLFVKELRRTCKPGLVCNRFVMGHPDALTPSHELEGWLKNGKEQVIEMKFLLDRIGGKGAFLSMWLKKIGDFPVNVFKGKEYVLGDLKKKGAKYAVSSAIKALEKVGAFDEVG